MKRKGISPLIAAVLLIAFTMAVASIFAQWAPQLIQDAQGDTDEKVSDLQDCSDITLEITSGDEENVTIKQTTGDQSVGNMTVTWTYDSKDPLQKDTNISDKRGIVETNNTYDGFNDGSYRGSSTLDEIQADPLNCRGAATATYTP